MESIVEYLKQELDGRATDYPLVEIPVEICEFIVNGAKPAQKDEYHYYCGHCCKRIPLKIKPNYCPKCGAKIRW